MSHHVNPSHDVPAAKGEQQAQDHRRPIWRAGPEIALKKPIKPIHNNSPALLKSYSFQTFSCVSAFQEFGVSGYNYQRRCGNTKRILASRFRVHPKGCYRFQSDWQLSPICHYFVKFAQCKLPDPPGIQEAHERSADSLVRTLRKWGRSTRGQGCPRSFLNPSCPVRPGCICAPGALPPSRFGVDFFGKEL